MNYLVIYQYKDGKRDWRIFSDFDIAEQWQLAIRKAGGVADLLEYTPL